MSLLLDVFAWTLVGMMGLLILFGAIVFVREDMRDGGLFTGLTVVVGFAVGFLWAVERLLG